MYTGLLIRGPTAYSGNRQWLHMAEAQSVCGGGGWGSLLMKCHELIIIFRRWLLSVWEWLGVGVILGSESHKEAVDGRLRMESEREMVVFWTRKVTEGREADRLKRLHQWPLVIGWIWGCRGQRMASLSVLSGRKQNPLCWLNGKGVCYKILEGNTIFTQARNPDLKGWTQSSQEKCLALPRDTPEWNRCCSLPGFCETRKRMPKALPQLSQKSWCLHLCDCRQRLLPQAQRKATLFTLPSILMKVQMLGWTWVTCWIGLQGSLVNVISGFSVRQLQIELEWVQSEPLHHQP